MVLGTAATSGLQIVIVAPLFGSSRASFLLFGKSCWVLCFVEFMTFAGSVTENYLSKFCAFRGNKRAGGTEKGLNCMSGGISLGFVFSICFYSSLVGNFGLSWGLEEGN